jgi:hypothetical protein
MVEENQNLPINPIRWWRPEIKVAICPPMVEAKMKNAYISKI